MPHLFERFYRGHTAQLGPPEPEWASGSFAGFSRPKAAGPGQNCPEGGARFSLMVPASIKDTDGVETQ